MTAPSLHRRVARLDGGTEALWRRNAEGMSDAQLEAYIVRELRKVNPDAADRYVPADQEARADMLKAIAAGEL